MVEKPERESPAAEPAKSEPSEGEAAKSEAQVASEPETTSVQEQPAEGSAEPAAGETKKKKKKKKKRREAAEPKEPVTTGPVLSEEGWERPGFVLTFPRDPELDRLVRAFELGDYGFVRERASELAERAKDPDVRAAAEELSRRIEPDPLVKILLGMSVALFLFMVFYAYSTHGH